jgi:hypothetical protein
MHPDHLAQLVYQHMAESTADAAHWRLIRQIRAERPALRRVWGRLRLAQARLPGCVVARASQAEPGT